MGLGDAQESRGLGDVYKRQEWLVFSPGVKWNEQPVGWYLANNGQADFMNGGGEWEVWTTHDQFSVV